MYLKWISTTSHLGACCSFNYNPTNMDYIPFSSNTFGVKGGLTIIGTGFPEISDGKSGIIFSAGFVVYLLILLIVIAIEFFSIFSVNNSSSK